MVPAEFTEYFVAAATAAGVLIGLLFVAVSLRSDTVFGDGAPAVGRAQAGSAFISLANCFFVSLVALIPGAGLGVVAVIMSVISLVATVRLHGQAGRQELHLVMLVLSLVAFVFQLVIGILMVISPGDHAQVYSMAYLEIALFAVALSRAWGLVEGKHLKPLRAPTTSRSADPVTRDRHNAPAGSGRLRGARYCPQRAAGTARPSRRAGPQPRAEATRRRHPTRSSSTVTAPSTPGPTPRT